MKTLPALILTLSTLFTTACAAADFDLKCTLTDNSIMTLSHSAQTIYIGFTNPRDVESEGAVIKLDVSSGEAVQTVGSRPAFQENYFNLRGNGEEIEGAVAITYAENKGVKSAGYTEMNSLGNETKNISCKPDTIEVANELLTSGISGMEKQMSHTGDTTNNTSDEEVSDQPVIKVSTEHFYLVNQFPKWRITLTSVGNNIIVKNAIMNRGNCTLLPNGNGDRFNVPLKFGDTLKFNVTTDENFSKCQLLELVVETNKGTFTFKSE
ncbi:hypothetical protein [Pantoea agglomerans]|uniref:hypothetical protein n=1 Tax=Enterobacter agglomerans TaxID=549 RepID=UPI00177AEF3A|nr:hypothetical protein [Pantoea agglomerans]MBD8198650.1 hypothetical protein [Pantoea agglomerans]